MMYDWGYGNNGWGVWGFIFMTLMMVLIITGVIVVIRYLINHYANTSNIQRGDTALDILQKRYAKGEIDKAEYDEKHKVLTK